MSITIYNYPLDITDEQTLMVPDPARVRHVGLDPNGVACLWAEVDPDAERVAMQVRIVGTGGQVPQGSGEHIGSFLGGAYVWHVYALSNDGWQAVL